MAYIYQISNDINNKLYIGKTEYPIEKRFKQHCRDSQKLLDKNRPLYAAMRKYGIEHFHISLLEETNNPEEREIYWIEQKRTFKNGYNATMGGDGKRYLDYDVLIASYLQTKSLTETSKIYNCDPGHLSQILKNNNIEVLNSQTVNLQKYGHLIHQYDLTGKYIQTFESEKSAARAVRPNTTSVGGVAGHIGEVCKGKRKTAYGFIWRYAD